MKKIGIARVSTAKQQQEGYSLEYQEERIREYAHPDQIDILKFTGSAFRTSEVIEELKKLQRQYDFQNMEIVVTCADRFSRNVLATTQFIDNVLRPKNAHIFSIEENIRTNTDKGRLEFIRRVTDGEWESVQISERVKKTQKIRSANSAATPRYYGSTEYEKTVVQFILQVYHSEIEEPRTSYTAFIMKRLKESNVKRKITDTTVQWNSRQICAIVNKFKSEYSNAFSMRSLQAAILAVERNDDGGGVASSTRSKKREREQQQQQQQQRMCGATKKRKLEHVAPIQKMKN